MWSGREERSDRFWFRRHFGLSLYPCLSAFATLAGWCVAMLRNAIRRSQSMPALEPPGRPLEHSLDYVALHDGIGLGRSVGTSDARSPKSYNALCEIRARLMSAQLAFRPRVQMEMWKGHVYVACWWQPQMGPLSVLDSSKWHSTVLRAWLSEGTQVAPWMPGWNMLLQGFGFSIVDPKLGLAGSSKVWESMVRLVCIL